MLVIKTRHTWTSPARLPAEDPSLKHAPFTTESNRLGGPEYIRAPLHSLHYLTLEVRRLRVVSGIFFPFTFFFLSVNKDSTRSSDLVLVKEENLSGSRTVDGTTISKFPRNSKVTESFG